MGMVLLPPILFLKGFLSAGLQCSGSQPGYEFLSETSHMGSFSYNVFHEYRYIPFGFSGRKHSIVGVSVLSLFSLKRFS